MNDEQITKAERIELARVLRMRSKIAKDDVSQREATLLADVEAQLSARYKIDNPAWADLTAAAEKVVEAADAEISKRCRIAGIPEEFRPKIMSYWYGRGESAVAQRRSELRRAAQTAIAALGKAAKLEIDKRTVDLLTQLASGALQSAEASVPGSYALGR